MTKTKIFQNGQVDETRRAHAITIRIRSAIADQIKPEFTFGRFDPSVRFAHRWTKSADLYFRIHDRPGRDLFESLFQNSDALAHFENAHHQSVVGVTMFAERHTELEARIKPIAVYFADVVIHAARAKHWASDAGIDRQISRKFADLLCARDKNFIFDN